MTDSVIDEAEHHADGDPPPLPDRATLVILSGLAMGIFLSSLSQMIVSTAIRTIADDLRGLSLMSWATTAYLITATITIPIYGKLSDIYGRKPVYVSAILLFLIGSIACAFAQSMVSLAVFRALQGLGAGGLVSLAFTIIGDIIPPRSRVRYQGYLVSVLVVSTALSPLLGGLFAELDSFSGLTGWRWGFLVNVPIGVASIVVVSRVLNVPHDRQRLGVDWRGAIALTIGLVPLILVVERGREWGWTSGWALVCFAAIAAGFVLFIWAQTRAGDAALLPLRLFRIGSFSVIICVGFLVGIGMYGAMMLIPQYLQIVRGFTPMQAGLLTLPLMFGIVASTTITGRIIAKVGRYKIFLVGGIASVSVGFLIFAQLEWNSALWQIVIPEVIIGLGIGSCTPTLVSAAQNAVPRRDLGVSTASATFFRQAGGMLGLAALFSILFSTLDGNIRAAFAELGLTPAPGIAGEVEIMRDSSFLKEIPLEQAQPYLMGFNDSVSTVFYVSAGIAALTSVVTMFMREIPLVDGSDGQSPVAS